MASIHWSCTCDHVHTSSSLLRCSRSNCSNSSLRRAISCTKGQWFRNHLSDDDNDANRLSIDSCLKILDGLFFWNFLLLSSTLQKADAENSLKFRQRSKIDSENINGNSDVGMKREVVANQIKQRQIQNWQNWKESDCPRSSFLKLEITLEIRYPPHQAHIV